MTVLDSLRSAQSSLCIAESSLVLALQQLQENSEDGVKGAEMLIKYAIQQISPDLAALDQKCGYIGVKDNEFQYKSYNVPPVVLFMMNKAVENARQELKENSDSEIEVDKLEELMDFLENCKIGEFKKLYSSVDNYTLQLVSEIVYNWIRDCQ